MAKAKAQNTSPLVIFLLYVIAAFAAVCGYRFLVPLQSPGIDILDCFRMPWRFYSGIIMFIELFPALACSGLVLPFGLKEHSAGGYAGNFFVGKKRFSGSFLQYFFLPVVTASFAAILYSLLIFLVLPLVTDFSYSIRDKSELFTRAKLKVEEKARAREWAEASQFIEICEDIWPGNEDIALLKVRLVDGLSSYRGALGNSMETPEEAGAGTGDPLDAALALSRARESFEREQFYDAHWLAALAERLGREGSAESSAARTLASQAWDKIAALEPSALEQEKYSLFQKKRDAYLAMDSGNWANAFYMFKELSVLTPQDPDVIKYLAFCETAVAKSAFFIDELDLALGETQNAAVFSLPGPDNGRIVLSFDSLALLQDEAYGWGTAIIISDSGGALRFRVESDYAKLIPASGMTSNEDASGGIFLLLQALDRSDESKSSGPVWLPEESASDPLFNARQLLLSIDFDEFMLLSGIRRGTETLSLRELFTAEKNFDQYGYVRESFRADIFRRLGTVLFFLPLPILTLVLGWRYRAGKKPRYVYVPMLAVLPVVFHGAALFFQSLIAGLAIWLSLSLGLSSALACVSAGAGVLFILTLVLLAAQHG